jgi:hypothetical protein
MFALGCWGRVGIHTNDALNFHGRRLSRASVSSITEVIQCIWVASAARAKSRRRIPPNPQPLRQTLRRGSTAASIGDYGVDLVKACAAAAAVVKVCWRRVSLRHGHKGPRDAWANRTFPEKQLDDRSLYHRPRRTRHPLRFRGWMGREMGHE